MARVFATISRRMRALNIEAKLNFSIEICGSRADCAVDDKKAAGDRIALFPAWEGIKFIVSVSDT